MGKTIEVRLSDAQYAALFAEAEGLGRKLFEHCRAKLVATTNDLSYGESPAMRALPLLRADNERKLAEGRLREAERPLPRIIPADDRIARLEDAIARLTNHVLGQAEPAAQQQEQYAPPDVDSIVDAQFAAAEAEGLTEVQPDQADIEMQHAGVRPLSRRPMPFSSANVPRHLQQLMQG